MSNDHAERMALLVASRLSPEELRELSEALTTSTDMYGFSQEIDRAVERGAGGLSAREAAIIAAADQDGCCGLTEYDLASSFHGTKGSPGSCEEVEAAKRAVDGLLERGFLCERKRVDDDDLSVAYFATDAGRRALAELFTEGE